MNGAEASKPERLQSIDAFRGLAVLLMAAANYIAGIAWIPAFLKHAPDVGYTVIDAIAPMFIVAIGFTAGLSFRGRRERQGAAAALGGMAARYLAILGLGAVITAGQALCLPGEGGVQPNWGVLQAIGAAGLITLTLIWARPWARIAAGIALLAGYQWLLDRYFLAAVLSSSHNGVVGSLSWGGLLMLATAAADLFFQAAAPGRKKLALLASGLAPLAAGLALSPWFPISKNRASVSYMLVTLGVCLLAFLLFHSLLDGGRPRLGWLRSMGRNPLTMYLAHLLILAVFALPGAAWWYAEAPAGLAAVQGVVLIGAMAGLAEWMERKRIIIKL
jgi:predicted acyltransferase